LLPPIADILGKRQSDGMTEPLDWEPVLAAIECGIVKARRDAEGDTSLANDGYTSFVILREIERHGWWSDESRSSGFRPTSRRS